MFSPSNVSECESNASDSSALNAWAREDNGLELRRPLRQAKIVFAEQFTQQAGADEFAPGQPGRMASVFGTAEVDLFNEFLARERDKESQKVVAMPYENISPCLDDNASESGIPTKGGTLSIGSAHQEWRRRPAWVRWVLTALVAVGVALQCSCMLITEIHVTGQKLRLFELLYWKGHPAAALAFLLGYGLIAAFISALLVLYVSPRAASSGIPDTKAYLNGHHLPGFLSFKAWFARTFALILVTSAGLFAGSEGPLVAHLGAIISSGVARGRLRLCGRRLRMPWRLTGHRAQCEFVAIGTAMGVSAAFGSPVGGVLFSLEEVSSFWSNELTWRAFFGSAIAALLAKGMKNGFGRKFLNSSFVEFPDAAADFQPWELLPITFIGVITGVLGAIFCRGCHKIGKVRSKIFTKEKPRRRLRVLEVLLLALAILLTCSLLPMAAGCRRLDVSKMDSDGSGGWHVGDQARGHCREGEYSDMATLLMQPKHKAIKALFTKSFNGGASFGPIALMSCCLIIFVFTLSANGMAMPYGLFVPHIMLGGCCGRAIGQLVQEITGDEAVHPGVYALVGAAGQLAGISRMTVSLTMIMVEITSNMRLMLPLMLCVMVSKFLADRTGPSVFDVALELNSQLQMLSGEWRESDVWNDNITVIDICSTQVIVIHCKERVSHIVKLLAQTDFQAFPLVEGQKAHVVGVIHRSKLICAISKETPSGSKAMIDLLPYANLTPEVKHWKTPVARVFTHFKSMGLSHLCVVDNHHGLMGFVTRSDMAQLGNSKGRRRLFEKLTKAVQSEQEKEAKEVVIVPPKEPVYVPPVEQLVENLQRMQSNSTQRSKGSDGSSSEDAESPPHTERSDMSRTSPQRSEGGGSPRLSNIGGPSRSNSLHSGVSGTGAEVRGLAAELLKAKERELLALRSENQQLRMRLKRLEDEDTGGGDEDVLPAGGALGASSTFAPSTVMDQQATGLPAPDPPGKSQEHETESAGDIAISLPGSPAGSPRGQANDPSKALPDSNHWGAEVEIETEAAPEAPSPIATSPAASPEAGAIDASKGVTPEEQSSTNEACCAASASQLPALVAKSDEAARDLTDASACAKTEATAVAANTETELASTEICTAAASDAVQPVADQLGVREGGPEVTELTSPNAGATSALDLSIQETPGPHSPPRQEDCDEQAAAAPATTISETVERQLEAGCAGESGDAAAAGCQETARGSESKESLTHTDGAGQEGPSNRDPECTHETCAEIDAGAEKEYCAECCPSTEKC